MNVAPNLKQPKPEGNPRPTAGRRVDPNLTCGGDGEARDKSKAAGSEGADAGVCTSGAGRQRSEWARGKVLGSLEGGTETA